MGKNFVQFSCHHCNHCCTEVVCLPTPFDVLRIAKHTGLHPKRFLDWLTPDEIDEVDNDDPTWLEYDDDKYVMALKRDEKTGCHFLDSKTRFCSIYDARPFLCRLYPFKVQEDRQGNVKGFTLHSDVGCPRHRDGKVDTAHLNDMYVEDCSHQDSYNDLVEIFNLENRLRTVKKQKQQKPQEFIKLFYRGS